MPTKPPAWQWHEGWLQAACLQPSPNFDQRPPGTEIDLLVIHSISLPPGQYGGPQIQQLFTNQLDPREHPYFAPLHGLKVSAHFLIRRQGQLLQFVPTHARAWHAGSSSWQGRSRCNDFSIGIELEGLEGQTFEPAQYTVLAQLCRSLKERYPIAHVAGHEHISPGRKNDPGPGFDWVQFMHQTQWPAHIFAPNTHY